jgi:hypothetical protein
MTAPETPASEADPTADSAGGAACSSDEHSHAAGSLSEEALKLAETLQTWLNTGAAMTGAGSASECKVCPLCQLIGVVNTMKPDVLAHLTEAGFSLVSAYKAATEAAERSWSSGNRPPVQHIKVT